MSRAFTREIDDAPEVEDPSLDDGLQLLADSSDGAIDVDRVAAAIRRVRATLTRQ